MIGPAWDSLLGKLIVTGATREQALQRAARALAEFEVDGLATALPFHRAVVTDPAFAPEVHGKPGPFTVHTRWIETEFRNDLPPWHAGGAGAGGPDGPADRQTVVVEVDGKRLEVTLPASLALGTATPPPNGPQSRRPRAPRQPGGRRSPATCSPPRCRERSSRSPSPRASGSRQATWSSSSRR